MKASEMKYNLKVVFLGATGAVGQAALRELQVMPEVAAITVLNRRLVNYENSTKLVQHVVDPLKPESYAQFLQSHDAALCTFGVGQPTKVSREEFKAVDYDAVLSFANNCRAAEVKHFELLGSVAASPHSSSFYLKSKGALREAIAALGFERFTCFQPSMLLTTENRYGLMQGILLQTWPVLSHAMFGPLAKYRGVTVEHLGAAMARNLVTAKTGFEILQWQEFKDL